MINFLYNCGINKSTIDYMNQIYDDNNLYNLSCNDENCLKIVEILKQIGVKIDVIENLLMCELDLFLKTCSEFVDILRYVDIVKFVNSINDDYLTISNFI